MREARAFVVLLVSLSGILTVMAKLDIRTSDLKRTEFDASSWKRYIESPYSEIFPHSVQYSRTIDLTGMTYLRITKERPQFDYRYFVKGFAPSPGDASYDKEQIIINIGNRGDESAPANRSQYGFPVLEPEFNTPLLLRQITYLPYDDFVKRFVTILRKTDFFNLKPPMAPFSSGQETVWIHLEFVDPKEKKYYILERGTNLPFNEKSPDSVRFHKVADFFDRVVIPYIDEACKVDLKPPYCIRKPPPPLPPAPDGKTPALPAPSPARG